MKTETSISHEGIWTTVDLPHLTSEECLSEIDYPVNSILTSLTIPLTDKMLQVNSANTTVIIQEVEVPLSNSEDTIVPQIKLKAAEPPNKDDKIVDPQKRKKTKTTNSYEDILYFVCNSCPYLCTKDEKITEHVTTAHRNQTSPKLLHLKCPACQNVFFHKVSLRSHLIHDHGVSNSDLSSIIQAVVYFAKKNQNKKANENQNVETKVVAVPSQDGINCKNEMDLIENSVSSSEKMLSNDPILSSDTDLQISNDSVEQVGTAVEMVDVNTILSKQNPLEKYIDQNTQQYKCAVPMCKVKMQDYHKINYHIGSHVDDGFKCLECNEMFTLWKPLTGHLWRVHKIDMELYSCDLCDYKTFSLGKLNNIHKPIHSDLKAFSCDECEKAFKNSKQLRNHKLTHKEKSQKNIYCCEVCNKSFFDRRQLKVHMDGVHKKIKPFLCSYCGYKGASKSALKMHSRQHTGEKPFMCDSCEYQTADHNSLRRHKLRHTGVKPYKCAHCDYACIQSSTYKVHLKTKHPGLEKDLMFVCPDCQFKSVNKEVYMNHLANVHKQKVFM